jgi:3-oxoadipate CoA-transferase alpha subunit
VTVSSAHVIEAVGSEKVCRTSEEAVSGVRDGDTVMVGGFGDVGTPFELIDALIARGVGNLSIIANNCGTGERGLAALFKNGKVRRIYASFPAQIGNHHFAAAYESGQTELVLIPQGSLAERIRAGGAGLGGVLTATGLGTLIADGKQLVAVDGHEYLIEPALRADVALIYAHVADTLGNLRYRLSTRNFNPIMAMAARVTVAEVADVVAAGALGPDDIHTPGVFVDRLWVRGRTAVG